jgi:hypothetical protein
LIVVLFVVGLKRLLRSDTATSSLPTIEQSRRTGTVTDPQAAIVSANPSGDLLLPVIDLRIAEAGLESQWSAALALRLSGQTEAQVEGGRVDVLTEHYAIEVDRLEKWHEAIGQAAHYGLKTGRVPVAAIMVPSDLWPISQTTKAKLLLIDETCSKQGIKLILLHRIEP